MKRFFTALLVFLFMLPCIATAYARPLRVLNMGWNEADVYLQAYPDRTIQVLTSEFDERGASTTQSMLLAEPNEWDAAFIWSNDTSLATLDQAGLLMDFAEVADLSARADDLYAAIRSAVTIDGRIIAMPVIIMGTVQQLGMLTTSSIERDGLSDILTPLGLSDTALPHTLAEIRGIAQRYMALPVDTRRGTTFHIDAMSGNPRVYFLYFMIDLYSAQFCDTSGIIQYDTPEFRRAVEDVDALAAELSKDRKTYYNHGSSSVYGLFYDASSALIAAHSQPLYLGIEGNTAIPARLGMVIVNAHSDQKTEALDFVRSSIQNHRTDGDATLLLHPDYEALARQTYDELIAAQIYQQEDQSIIDALTQERDAGGYPRYYSQESIERYRQDVVPHLTFPRLPMIDSYSIAKAYASGKLDVDGLIATLTEATQANTN